MQPFVVLTTSAFATMRDFGAGSARPTPLRVYASTRRSPGAGARLATGLAATAFAGLDLHQLDSIQRFHVLMYAPRCHAFRGATKLDIHTAPPALVAALEDSDSEARPWTAQGVRENWGERFDGRP